MMRPGSQSSAFSSLCVRSPALEIAVQNANLLLLGTHGKRGVIGVVWLVAVAMHVGREM